MGISICQKRLRSYLKHLTFITVWSKITAHFYWQTGPGIVIHTWQVELHHSCRRLEVHRESKMCNSLNPIRTSWFLPAFLTSSTMNRIKIYCNVALPFFWNESDAPYLNTCTCMSIWARQRGKITPYFMVLNQLLPIFAATKIITKVDIESMMFLQPGGQNVGEFNWAFWTKSLQGELHYGQ